LQCSVHASAPHAAATTSELPPRLAAASTASRKFSRRQKPPAPRRARPARCCLGSRWPGSGAAPHRARTALAPGSLTGPHPRAPRAAPAPARDTPSARPVPGRLCGPPRRPAQRCRGLREEKHRHRHDARQDFRIERLGIVGAGKRLLPPLCDRQRAGRGRRDSDALPRAGQIPFMLPAAVARDLVPGIEAVALEQLSARHSAIAVSSLQPPRAGQRSAAEHIAYGREFPAGGIESPPRPHLPPPAEERAEKALPQAARRDSVAGSNSGSARGAPERSSAARTRSARGFRNLRPERRRPLSCHTR